jgi:hypothetical protein
LGIHRVPGTNAPQRLYPYNIELQRPQACDHGDRDKVMQPQAKETLGPFTDSRKDLPLEDPLQRIPLISDFWAPEL